jgi:hypothetical protein
VNTQKEDNEKKQSKKANPFPHCEGFQKMAEMMKTCCPSEGDAIDCCAIMRKMMDRGKGGEAKKAKETQKQPKGRENG